MNPLNQETKTSTVVEVNWADRWQVYHRLQELQVPCQCLANQPLQVEINTPLATMQLWSILRRLTASRPESLSWLECCWRIKNCSQEN